MSESLTHHGPLGRQLLDDERRQEHAREHERSVDHRQRDRPEALHLKSEMSSLIIILQNPAVKVREFAIVFLFTLRCPG